MFEVSKRSIAALVSPLLLAISLVSAASAQQTPYFTPGNIVVSVEGNGVVGGSGTYGDNQAAPLTLFQYQLNSANPTTVPATYVNSLVLPQTASGANAIVSGEYGSSSEATIQLSGSLQYLTVMGYGVNATTFNNNPNAYSASPNSALAQSGSLTGQSYTPVPRVVALIDAYGNVNSSTVLYNIFDNNNPRSAYTIDGTSVVYVSGQGATGDATSGVFLAPVGGIDNNPTAITGLDASSKTVSQDTRDVQIYGGTLYISLDSKAGSGNNRSMVATLGTPPATGLYNSGGGPTEINGYGNSGGTGKETMTTANANNLNSGLSINLSPENYFFASPSVLYVADSGSPKNDSNATGAGVDLGDGGLQKWVNSSSNGSGTWSLKYTMYKGLNLVPNATAGGTAGATGLIGLTGKVVGSNVELFATNYNIGDLDPTYLYAISDPLAATTNPGTSFTQLATAPADSNFKGVSFAPSLPTGASTITSSPSGLAFTSSGTGCVPGAYTTPVTLIWTPGSTCSLTVVTPQTATGTDYVFSQWQDGTTGTTDTVTAQSSATVYNATFTTAYQLTTSAGTGGSVSPGGFYTAGTYATITATPAAGYYFVNFTGATTSTSNPLSLLMSAPESITANFAPQVTPTVTFPTATAITYGNTVGSSTLSGGSASANSASVAGTFTFNNPSVIPVAGTYAASVTFTPANSAEYTSVTANVNVTVNQAPLTVTVNPASFTYGGSLPTFTGNVTGLVNGDTVGSNLLVSYSTGVSAASNAGSYTNAITATVSGSAAGNYSISTTAGTLTILQAPLSVTVNPASFTYGGAFPTFSGSVTGLVNGDTSNAKGVTRPAVVRRSSTGTDIVVTYSSTVAASSNAGTYTGALTATVGGTAAGNYSVTVTPATLTITQAALSVTVNSDSFTYGGAPASPYSGSVTGLVNGDTSNAKGITRPAVTRRNDTSTDIVITYALDPTVVSVTSPVGTYANGITATVGGTAAGNYVVTVTPGTLTINQATLTVTVNPASFTYGGPLPNFSGTVSGLTNGDTSNLKGVTRSATVLRNNSGTTDIIVTYSTSVPATSSVGDYSGAITATIAGSAAGNYAITVVPADLTITTAPLTVTVNPASFTYGGTLPTFTGSVMGLVNGDTSNAKGIVRPAVARRNDSATNDITVTYSTSIAATSNAGDYSGAITANVSGSAASNYSVTVVPADLTIATAPLTVTVNSASFTYDGTLPTFSGSVNGLVNGDTSNVKGVSRPATVRRNDTGTNDIDVAYALDPTIVTPTSDAGTYPNGITASVGGSAASNYSVTVVPATLTITQASQTITFPAIANQYAQSSIALSATASSNLAVTYSSNTPSVCTVSGTQAMLNVIGTCSITATQAGNRDYTAAAIVNVFNVIGKPQSIVFTKPANQVYGASVALSATATSGLAVSFSSLTPSVCTVNGNSASATAGGACTIQAAQSGNSIYAAAPTTTQGFTVTAATQTISFATLPALPIGSTQSVSARASSGLPVTLAVSPSTVCTLSGDTVSGVGVGTCKVTASQAGNADYKSQVTSASFSVTLDPQTIAFTTATPQDAGTSITLKPSASSGLPVTLTSNTTAVCTVSGYTATLLTPGTCSITASQAGNATYAAAKAVTDSFTVVQLTQTIAFGTITTQYVGTTLTLSASSTAGLPVTFSTTSAPSVCTVADNAGVYSVTTIGVGSCTVVASAAGNTEYKAASPVSKLFSVVQQAQTITFPTPPAQVVGGNYQLSATSTSGLAITYTAESSACTVSSSGLATFVSKGTCKIAASQPGNTDYKAASVVIDSFAVNAAP